MKKQTDQEQRIAMRWKILKAIQFRWPEHRFAEELPMESFRNARIKFAQNKHVQMPIEMLLMIVGYLEESQDLYRFGATCKNVHYLVHHQPIVWQNRWFVISKAEQLQSGWRQFLKRLSYGSPMQGLLIRNCEIAQLEDEFLDTPAKIKFDKCMLHTQGFVNFVWPKIRKYAPLQVTAEMCTFVNTLNTVPSETKYGAREVQLRDCKLEETSAFWNWMLAEGAALPSGMSLVNIVPQVNAQFPSTLFLLQLAADKVQKPFKLEIDNSPFPFNPVVPKHMIVGTTSEQSLLNAMVCASGSETLTIKELPTKIGARLSSMFHLYPIRKLETLTIRPIVTDASQMMTDFTWLQQLVTFYPKLKKIELLGCTFASEKSNEYFKQSIPKVFPDLQVVAYSSVEGIPDALLLSADAFKQYFPNAELMLDFARKVVTSPEPPLPDFKPDEKVWNDAINLSSMPVLRNKIMDAHIDHAKSIIASKQQSAFLEAILQQLNKNLLPGAEQVREVMRTLDNAEEIRNMIVQQADDVIEIYKCCESPTRSKTVSNNYRRYVNKYKDIQLNRKHSREYEQRYEVYLFLERGMQRMRNVISRYCFENQIEFEDLWGEDASAKREKSRRELEGVFDLHDVEMHDAMEDETIAMELE